MLISSMRASTVAGPVTRIIAAAAVNAACDTMTWRCVSSYASRSMRASSVAVRLHPEATPFKRRGNTQMEDRGDVTSSITFCLSLWCRETQYTLQLLCVEMRV